MHEGKRYVISCKALNVPPTKEASYQAANDWWRSKVNEIDAQLPPKDRKWQALELLVGKPIETSEEYQQAWQYVREKMTLDPSFELPPLEAGFHRLWLGEERFRQIEVGVEQLKQGKAPELDRTVKGQVDRWVRTQQALARAGKITVDRADNNRIALNHFRDFLGEASPLEIIDAGKLHDFFLSCLAKVTARKDDQVRRKNGWSSEYASKVFGVSRQFIKFLWEGNLIDLPRNIDNKTYRFGKGAKKVRTWDVNEVKDAVHQATGQLRLHLLLMVNCGMLQTDISELRKDEVDWAKGRIIRKRSKTDHHEDVPTVDYELWPLTFDLLKKYRSQDPEIALLTENGNRWVCKRLTEDGKLVKSDNIASCYVWLKKKTANSKPLKQLRKTSASLIESHKEYGRYKGHFLGHSPRTIADKHYAAPSQELFDEIIFWLGEQYGFC